MAPFVRVYIKKKLTLNHLTIGQREMYEVGRTALQSIKRRVAAAIGSNDAPAPPLKTRRARRWSESKMQFVESGPPRSGWARIKMKYGLRPVRDLHGTGLMWSGKIAEYTHRELKKKSKLKNVGHLMDQLLIRRVSDKAVIIDEPSQIAGRMKALANRDMLLLSPNDCATIDQAVKYIVQSKVRHMKRVG
jgi:hypothetical protein